MREKILKIELSALFVITLSSLVFYYFSESLPDHFLSISSVNVEVGFFSYYLTSFLGLINYYTGPWIFLSFSSFILFYVTLYTRRDLKFDVFNIIPLSLTFLFMSFLFFPSFLGEGVYYVLKSYFSRNISYLLFFAFFSVSLWGCFRSSFKETLMQIIFSIKEFTTLIMEKKRSLKAMKKKSDTRVKRILPETKVRLEKILKGEDQNEKDLTSPSNVIQTTAEKIIPTAITEGLSKTVETAKNLNPLTSPKKEIKVNIEDQNKFLPQELISSLSGSSRPDLISPNDSYFHDIILALEEKLNEFKIEGTIVNIMKGPVVDTFELELGPGVKVSKVNSITEDLSLALKGTPLRLVYPLTGRSTMGIEVPRHPRETIFLDDVLKKPEFLETNKKLPICMGKDAYGETFVVDLAKMPHMLIAGATGAGKSVFINTLLVSLLVKKSPAEMKLILIDPKQLELALYSNLPHLMLPVVTEGKHASLALLWAVQEMERRYSILKTMGVRSIDGFNEKIKTASKDALGKLNQYYEGYEDRGYQLPYLVIVIDEFADLRLTKVGQEIETNVARLAAKARAAGIHLVLATQRPSVDVITGVIKSNFPTRVSFKVTTNVDSRTILDKQGAEKLLGMGDMLYKQGTEIRRLHSGYVDEAEIEVLMDKLAAIPQSFDEKAMDFIESGGEDTSDDYTFNPTGYYSNEAPGGEGLDKKYAEAVDIVIESGKASASYLQRRLGVGYNRAANMVETMENQGIVGPSRGSKPREILVASNPLK